MVFDDGKDDEGDSDDEEGEGDDEEDEGEDEGEASDEDEGDDRQRWGRGVSNDLDETEDVDFADTDSELGDDEEDEDDHAGSDAGEDDGAMDTADGGAADDDADLASAQRWRANMDRMAERVGRGRRVNLMSLVYGEASAQASSTASARAGAGGDEAGKPTAGKDDEDDLFVRKVPSASAQEAELNAVDGLKSALRSEDYAEEAEQWSDDELLDTLRNRFITGAPPQSAVDRAAAAAEDEADGDFEDLETGETHTAAASHEPTEAELQKKKELLRQKFIAQYGTRTASARPGMTEVDAHQVPLVRPRWRRRFDADADAEMDEDGKGPGGKEASFYDKAKAEIDRQLKANRAEFADDAPEARVRYEGYGAGARRCAPCKRAG